VIEAAVIVLRLLQYATGAILMGSALFALYALPRHGAHSATDNPWLRPLLVFAALVLGVSAGLGLLAQTIVLAGSFEAGLTPDALQGVVSGMSLGLAAVVRVVAAFIALLLLVTAGQSQALWPLSAAAGIVAVATFGWMGHGADTEAEAGLYHLAAEVLHALTAAAWIGALVAFVFLFRQRADLSTVHNALRRFSQIGVPLVAVLVLTGLVNSWFLVGPDNLAGLFTTPYGRLLLAKLGMFAGMLVLAALNRNRHTPAIEASLSSHEPSPMITARLRRSIALEAALGLGVLGVVAWFGTLAPPASG